MVIMVDGQSYDGWDDLPEELRSQLAGLPDADHNGVPDVFEGRLDSLFPGGLSAGGDVTSTTSTTSVELDGQTYTSLDQVPPALRAVVQRALAGGPGEAAAEAAVEAGPTTGPATGPAPGPGQVVLNGETVTLDPAGVTPARSGWFRRLFGG